MRADSEDDTAEAGGTSASPPKQSTTDKRLPSKTIHDGRRCFGVSVFFYVVCVCGGEGVDTYRCLQQCLRVCEANVFGCKPDQPPCNISWVFPCFEHPCEPVDGCIRVPAAHAFVERRYDVVVFFACTIVKQVRPLDCSLDVGHGQLDNVGCCSVIRVLVTIAGGASSSIAGT